MSDNSTAVEVSNAQRGERILAAPREEGKHTDFGNEKWKGTGPLSDFLSLVHGLKAWQYWHSYTNSALATMHQALPGFCLLSLFLAPVISAPI